jgi:hypothetical protein
MKCRFCGIELEENVLNCPACGKKVKKDKFPVWAIVLMAMSGCGCSLLPIVGIVAAMTIPTLVAISEGAKFRSHLKKVSLTFNDAYLMEKAINGEYYSNPDDVWTKTIKGRTLYNDIDGGIKLADGTEIKYTKLRNECQKVSEVSETGAYTACGELTIDLNGFDKNPNKYTQNAKRTQEFRDRYTLWMYSDKVVVGSNSVEDKILNDK